MDYLNTTLKYLEEQNKDLKEKLKRLTNLNEIINKQRQAEEKEYIVRFHQEEINVIRELADSNERLLKNEIKRLNEEITELNESFEREINAGISLKKEISNVKRAEECLRDKCSTLQNELTSKKQTIQTLQDGFILKYEQLEEEYQQRQQEVIAKFISKLDEAHDHNDEQLSKKNKFIDYLQNKLNNLEQEKVILEDEIRKLIATLNDQSENKSKANRIIGQQINQAKKESTNLKVYIKNLEKQLLEKEEKLSRQEKKYGYLQRQYNQIKLRFKQAQQLKKKQVERQKSKAKSISKDLTNHKKYIKEQLEQQKKKQKEFNNSKKLLIRKIKQIQQKYQHEKSSYSILDKTATRTVKKSLQTFQSISLDNSFTRESPSVSCFLKEKLQSKSQIKKKELKIDTKLNHINLLKLNDLDTPCFQSSRGKDIKRTIKIRK